MSAGRCLCMGTSTIVLAALVATLAPVRGADPSAASPAPGMVQEFLLDGIDRAAAERRREWDALASPADVTARQRRLTQAFHAAIGPFPERTPLHSQVTGRVVKEGYAVEKIMYASQPGIVVTAGLFLPDERRFPPPWPATLVACGHADSGKALDAYQRAAALLATRGIAALLFDPIGQGERRQFVTADGRSACGGCLGEHNAVGAACIPLGRNLASWMIWDGIRGLDYLASRPDIRADRLGCMGNSGGGTQTSYIMAVDDRVAAAAVSCYLTSLFGKLPRTIGPQDAEQNIFGQLAFGMDHADLILMRAPRPTLVCAATRDFFDIGDTRQAVADARRVYDLCSAGERLALAEADAEHGFSQPLREAACRFMLRWLAGREEAVVEPAALEVLTPAEIACTPTGSVLALPDSRTFMDLAADASRRLAALRRDREPEEPAAFRERVRRRSGMRPTDEADAPVPRATVVNSRTAGGHRIDRLAIETEPGIVLPAEFWRPAESTAVTPARPVAEDVPADALSDVLYVDGGGMKQACDPAGEVPRLVAAGRRVLVVDVRGMGETAPEPQRYFNVDRHGANGQDAYLAYLLGRSLVGMQADDIVACSRWLAAAADGHDANKQPIALVATGLATIPAAHAAAVHPRRFATTRLEQLPRSWSSFVEGGLSAREPLPLASLIHGVLDDYDLPDLVEFIGRSANGVAGE